MPNPPLLSKIFVAITGHVPSGAVISGEARSQYLPLRVPLLPPKTRFVPASAALVNTGDGCGIGSRTKSTEAFAVLLERYPSRTTPGGNELSLKLNPAPAIAPEYLITGNCPGPEMPLIPATLTTFDDPPVTSFTAKILVISPPIKNCSEAFVNATVSTGNANEPTVFVIANVPPLMASTFVPLPGPTAMAFTPAVPPFTFSTPCVTFVLAAPPHAPSVTVLLTNKVAFGPLRFTVPMPALTPACV